jgi:hypothetical protein
MTVLTIVGADYFTVQLSSSFISAPKIPHNNALSVVALTGHIQHITTVKSSLFQDLLCPPHVAFSNRKTLFIQLPLDS